MARRLRFERIANLGKVVANRGRWFGSSIDEQDVAVDLDGPPAPNVPALDERTNEVGVAERISLLARDHECAIESRDDAA